MIRGLQRAPCRYSFSFRSFSIIQSASGRFLKNALPTERRIDEPTDRRTDHRTNGQSLIQRCRDASKNVRKQKVEDRILQTPTDYMRTETSPSAGQRFVQNLFYLHSFSDCFLRCLAQLHGHEIACWRNCVTAKLPVDANCATAKLPIDEIAQPQDLIPTIWD